MKVESEISRKSREKGAKKGRGRRGRGEEKKEMGKSSEEKG